MRGVKLIFIGTLLVVATSAQPDFAPASGRQDGKGGVACNIRIVIEGAKIVAVDAKAGRADYDLRSLTSRSHASMLSSCRKWSSDTGC
jgi:hypothetical protein